MKVDYKKIDKAEDLAKAGVSGQAQYKVSVTVGGPDAKVGPLADKIKSSPIPSISPNTSSV